MAQLSDKVIDKSDIEQYLNKNSDFVFEMKVLEKLVSLKYDCEHSGTYIDPVTTKGRQFDIRAVKKVSNRNMCFSVETKNLRPNFPLVIHAVPRRTSEGFHQVLIGTNIKTNSGGIKGVPGAADGSNFSRVLRIDNTLSTYIEKDFVGKSMDQVGVNTKNEITSNDGDVFEKMNQAVNSAYDFIRNAHQDREAEKAYTVIPVLVVPDEMLWQVNYNNSGKIIEPPKQVTYIPFYIGKSWTVDGEDSELTFSMSHLEILTLSRVEYIFGEHFTTSSKQYSLFPFD